MAGGACPRTSGGWDPLQLAAWGENWHLNHHSDASSARFGRRAFQVDIGWALIGLLERLGLATAVRRPRVTQGG